MRYRQVRWPDPDEAQHGFAFDRYGFYDPELRRAPLLVRRGVGRVLELATDARRRLSESRAAMRVLVSLGD
jgi:hypothetical protein